VVSDDAPAAGWEAIDARLAQFYPGVEPQHYGTLIKYRLGGPDPLDGISFYARTESSSHWHVIGYGMTELYVKESPAADVSGWGFEFTMRVARAADETQPPIWAANLLQNLARYVFSSGNPIGPGDHMNANGPISLDRPTALTALAFTVDPTLGEIGTPHGSVRFLQVVGLTADEYAAARRWRTDGVLDLLAGRDPLLITDLARPSLLADPAARAAIEAGVARDGSSTGQLFVAGFRVSGADRLHFGEVTVPLVAQAIRDRLPHGRPLVIDGDQIRVVLRPGPSFTVERSEGVLELTLPPDAVSALPSALTVGTRAVPGAPGLSVEVAPAGV
jgi:suppressor of fused